MMETTKMRRDNQIQSKDLRSNIHNDSNVFSAEKTCDIKVLNDIFKRVKNLENENVKIFAILDEMKMTLNISKNSLQLCIFRYVHDRCPIANSNICFKFHVIIDELKHRIALIYG